MVNTYSRRPNHWWRLWPSQVLPECRSLAFEGRAQTFQFPPALAAPGRPRWWPWWSACWHLGRSPGYDWCPRSRYQLEERGENRILKNWKDQGVHLLAFICVGGTSPSAETGSALRERTVTVPLLDRSVPVRHTLTSTYPSLSSTW